MLWKYGCQCSVLAFLKQELWDFSLHNLWPIKLNAAVQQPNLESLQKAWRTFCLCFLIGNAQTSTEKATIVFMGCIWNVTNCADLSQSKLTFVSEYFNTYIHFTFCLNSLICHIELVMSKIPVKLYLLNQVSYSREPKYPAISRKISNIYHLASELNEWNSSKKRQSICTIVMNLGTSHFHMPNIYMCMQAIS